MTTQLQRGVDPKGLLGGLVTGGIGVAAIIATASGMRFAYRNLALPEWAVYAFGAVLLLIAAFSVVKAMKSLKCACGSALDEGRVILPGDGGREAPIVQAVRSAQIDQLAVFIGQSDDFSLKLQFQFCPLCSKTASLTLLKNDSDKLVEDQVLIGAPAIQAIAFMKRYGKTEDD